MENIVSDSCRWDEYQEEPIKETWKDHEPHRVKEHCDSPFVHTIKRV